MTSLLASFTIHDFIYGWDIPEWAYRLIAGISGTLSLLGSSYIVLSCLLLIFGIVKQSSQTTNVPLVLSLSIADFFSSFSYMTICFNLHNRFWIVCQLQAFWMQLFELASILSTGAVSLYLLASIIFRVRGKALSVINGVGIFTAWVVPVVLALLLLPLRGYGPSGPWCWVEVYGLKFLFFYNFLFLVVVVNVLIYLAVFLYLTLLGRKVSRKNRHTFRFARSLLAYLLVFFMVWTMPVVYRLLSLFMDVSTPLLVIPVTALNPCGGLFNGIIYGYFARVHQTWYRWFCRRRRAIVSVANPLARVSTEPESPSGTDMTVAYPVHVGEGPDESSV
ncbi:Slime mold cyclic AMP receptor [Carpediemonas membranifera]|uniref:Slime mold cyclic AMP receptor n=1 Tax=Carpediemonas membranifera TaxID=201153 RepID=A0A8J6B883_9EUKA|nr:Slime mold cyclic AMP receptor [Carpediemonas membranifera]|eukprot:KAG9395189.1 Slime mold cyclic AMP receptor [Carpediemonas membranifera]